MTSPLKTLGIIAGAGGLPYEVCSACEASGTEVTVIAVHDDVDPRLMDGRDSLRLSMGQAGTIVKELQKRRIHDLVMIGRVQRPTLSDIKPDFKTAKFFARIAFKTLGDDGLLTAVRRELERDGFTLHGAHQLAPNLLMPAGVLGACEPQEQDHATIEAGIQAAQKLGAEDKGQSVIAQNGEILGLEDAKGTDALMERCNAIQKADTRGGILVKTAKPHQDLDMDMPTIGLHTVQKAHECGYVGIAVEAGKTLVADRESLVSFADQHKIFVIGLEIKTA